MKDKDRRKSFREAHVPIAQPGYEPINLGKIPLELVEAIVDAVKEIQMNEDGAQLFKSDCYPLASDPTHPISVMSDVHSLALVNSTFRHMLLPFLWHGIDLEGLTNTQITRGMDIFRFHAKHIRHIWARIRLDDDERMAMRKADRKDIRPGVRRHLLVQLIGSVLVDLNSIDMDFDNKGGQLVPAILKHRKTLEALALANSGEDDLSAKTLSSLIGLLPRVGQIDLEGTSPDHDHVLRDAICSRPELTDLVLFSAPCLDDSWASCDWPSTLTRLELDMIPELSSEGLEALLLKLGPQLSILRIDECPNSTGNALEDGPKYDMPLLDSLQLGEIPMGIGWLKRFSGLPIKEFSVVGLWNISVDEICEVLQAKTFPQLVNFVLENEGEWATGEGQIDRLRQACDDIKITFLLEDATSTVPSDSEPEDEWIDED